MNAGDCGQQGSAAGWVLGTLEPIEAERFAEHLKDCPDCQAAVAELREAADAMADAVPPAAPSAGLRARLMAAVRLEADLFQAAGNGESRPRRNPEPRRRLLGIAPLVLGAALFMLAGVLLGSMLTDENTRPSRTLIGQVTEPGASQDARAAVVIRGDDVRLELSNLDAPPRGRIYKTWLERPASKPAPAGALFSIGTDGDATISLPSLRGVERLIVTSEAEPDSRLPTLPPVVIVRLPGS